MQNTHDKITSLQHWMKQQQLDALIISHEDEYLSEYLPEHNQRLLWLTGFTGSAGLAVITQTNNAIFVDGRYTVQVTKQVSNELFQYCHLIDDPISSWLTSNLPPNGHIGFDARAHTAIWLEQLEHKLKDKHSLCPLSYNPIDLLWQDRPSINLSDIHLMSIDQVGQSTHKKSELITATLSDQQADAVILAALDSICWLLNVRGQDIPHLPVVLSHAIVYKSGLIDWFVDSHRLPSTFDIPNVNVISPDLLESKIASFKNQRVMLDTLSANAWFKLQLEAADAHIIECADPCALPKATKNNVEIAGMKDAHIRDGVAMVKFLAWLDDEVSSGHLHDEAKLADKLESFRREEPLLVDLSFDTISAAAGNAAMCHYNHNDENTPGRLSHNSLYLVDSGGQYINGTTDITRTIAIGDSSDFMKQQFTLVLKGHISIASALFPEGTCGYQIDALARQHLWERGYDFDHGTGHGVGHFLSVHEGPQSISKKQINVPLKQGMVLSNEPGYYRENEFGIRIENLEIVLEKKTEGDKITLGFESLTRCPIDKRNIAIELLTDKELEWLNNYHNLVWNDLESFVEGKAKQWLQQATSPIYRD